MSGTSSNKRPIVLLPEENGLVAKKIRLGIDTPSAESTIQVRPSDGPADNNDPGSSEQQRPLTSSFRHAIPNPVSRLGLKPQLPELPASLELVTGVKTDLRARKGFVGQEDVGIVGYAGKADVHGIRGVIKQR